MNTITNAGYACMARTLRTCLKIPERGCVVLDQPQQVSISRCVEKIAACCGWSSTQPRSFFRQALCVLALAGLLAAAPATAQVNYAVSGNTAYVASSPTASGDIVIASTYSGYPVTSIGDYAFSGCTSLTSVTIPNSVTNLGDYAFNYCSNLANVTIPNGVPTIGFRTFFSCSSLTSVTIPNSVTSIQNEAFRWCSGLTNVTIPNSVTVIWEWAFQTCTSLTSVTIPNSVTYLWTGAFQNCTSLTNVTIGNSVTTIVNSAFAGCTSLTSVSIPNSVTSIATDVFAGCTSLTNLSVDAANPVYSSLDGVLFNKAQTTLALFPPGRSGSYVIPNSVTRIGSSAFSGCAGLTSVTIPNSVTGTGEGVFSRCNGLTNVIIGHGLTSIGSSAFASCTNLASVTIGNSVTNIAFYAFASCRSLASVTIPNSVTSIGGWAFYNCASLTSLTIPNVVTTLGDSAFLMCINLTNFTFLGDRPRLVPNFEVGGFSQFQGVGPGAKVYYYCGTTGWGATYGGLPTVLLCPPQVNYAVSGSTAYVTSSPNASGDVVIASTFNGYPVTSIGSHAFTNCTSLTSVTIPNSVTNFGSYAFTRCISLTNMTVPDSVTSIGYRAFRECWSLRSINIPKGVTNISPELFQICTSLTNVSVDSANPAYSSLDGVVFNKAQTTLIAFPGGRGNYVMPASVTNIGELAFSYCTLTNVTIGNSVTSIEDWAFFQCSSLKGLTVGNSVTRIGDYVFFGCTSLTNFTFLGNAPGYVGINLNNFGPGAKVYYYCGTTGWGETYGGLPTVMLCPPGIAPGGAGLKPGGFGFTLTRPSNQPIVVEASADLLNWHPIWTNSMPVGSVEFVDPEWLQHPSRFYRARPE